MGNRWTDEQLKAISLHNRNLLVSAAAGSGKTAVLVERIIQMITGEQAIDVDSLLVLTFTRAAASEMKERIALRLNEMMDSDGADHNNLQRQLALLKSACITTIDSFCLRVVRDYFGELDLDPDFRVADEGEKTLLEADCMEELLERSYEEGNPVFLDFAESYGGKKSDGQLEQYIAKLYRFSQSDPYPEEWLKAAARTFRADNEAEVEALEPVRYLVEDYKKSFSDLLPLAEELHEICLEADGPDAYEAMCRSDLEQLQGILAAGSLKELCSAAAAYRPVRKTTKKMPEADPSKKAYVSEKRDLIKGALQKKQKDMAKIDPDEILPLIRKMKAPMEMLISLTLSFTELVREAKAEKNILDFSDVEHLALKILLDDERKPSAAAKELQRQYTEILVDEYQDSNYLQDTLLDAVSRRWNETPNMFMVGDVKQSIYRFRMARPEIFMDRYDTYGTEEGLYQKINLARNFRSREEVLEGINLIFERIMTRKLGDVEYDRAARLYPGADYKELVCENVLADQSISDTAQEEKEPDPIGEHYITGPDHKALKLILTDLNEERNEEFLQANSDGMQMDGLTAQAQAVAEEIERLTDQETGMFVQDKKTGLYRKASYRDITILMRSVSGKADTFLEVLSARGIPVCAEAKGYFSALEVKTMLCYLQIIDNPFQDIPLVSVMKSPIWDFRAEQLAEIRAFYKNAGPEAEPRFYSAVKYYLRQHPEAVECTAPSEISAGQKKAEPTAETLLCRQLLKFLDTLAEFNKCAVYMQVQELIQHIYKETGYYDYVSAMPAGLVRKRNLDMLVEKAISFEKTSYHGLYQFVRYIDHLEKYEVDFEQGQMFGEQDDIVRIMSVHKSKGLEFPIVILADMNKQFNLQDAYAGITAHADFGIAADYIDTEKRCRIKTILSLAMKQRIVNDTLGEELRLLYVAMTRAREKLILVGSTQDADKLLDKYAQELPSEGPLSYQKLSSAKNYLDWVLMAAGEKLEDWMDVSIPSLGEVFMPAVQEEIANEIQLAGIRELAEDQTRIAKDDIWDRLTKLTDFKYAYAQACEIQSKFSVSELKHKAMKDKGLEPEEKSYRSGYVADAESAMEHEILAAGDEENEVAAGPGTPDLAAGRRSWEASGKAGAGNKLTAADRGTAFHALLELLNPSACSSPEMIREGVEKIVALGKVQADHAALVNPKKLFGYYSSLIGQRFIAAHESGKLHREQAFIMNIPAREANPEWDSDEPVLIQGIIDVFWEETDGIVLLDYKTDKRTSEELYQLYKRQFELYAQAISQILGKKVKEQYIWSFHLNKEIRMDI